MERTQDETPNNDKVTDVYNECITEGEGGGFLSLFSSPKNASIVNKLG